jgi:hypothetical protein
MSPFRTAAALCAAFLFCGPVWAELGFSEQFAPGRGSGSGKDMQTATKHALQDALSDKLREMTDKSELREHSGYDKALEHVHKTYRNYIHSYEVVSQKSKTVEREDDAGRKVKEKGYDVTVQALLNVARLKKDLHHLLRIAELSRFGSKLGVLLEEWAGEKEEARLSPHGYAMQAVERIFMTCKYRQVPLLRVKERFGAEVGAGKRLSDETYKEEIKKSLKALGSDIVLVGSVTAVFQKKGKLKKDRKKTGCLFKISAWIEGFERKKLRLLGKVEWKEREMEVEGEDEDAALSQVFSDAGEQLAGAIIDVIIEEKEEEGPEEEPAASYFVIFEGATPGMRSGILSKLKNIEGVEDASFLRFGRGAVVTRVKAAVAPDDFAEALRKTFRSEGFGVRSADGKKVILGR